MAAFIKPTIGRIVRFVPSTQGNPNLTVHTTPEGESPRLAAIITHVWNDRMVNLAVFDSNGLSHAVTSVDLEHGDRPVSPTGRFCEWMPYQKGQAAKYEALEAEALEAETKNP